MLACHPNDTVEAKQTSAEQRNLSVKPGTNLHDVQTSFLEEVTTLIRTHLHGQQNRGEISVTGHGDSPENTANNNNKVYLHGTLPHNIKSRPVEMCPQK